MNRATLAVALIFIPILALMAAQRDRDRDRYIATDGDTISHNGERIRLLYIDAPEMPGSPRDCSRATCPAGDPYAAQAALQRALSGGRVNCEGDELDRYGRRLAECFVTAPSGQSVSVNEWLLSTGHALPYRYRGSNR